MALLEDLLDAFAADGDVDVIKAGTLRTTRGTALSLIAFLTVVYAVDGFGNTIDWVTADNKYLLALGAGLMWAIVAAADALARGIATGRTEAATVAASASYALGAVLTCTRTEGPDDPGWKAVAIRRSTSDDGPEFLLTKGAKVEWVKAEHLKFG
jgi:hypothetical protein